MTFIRRCVREDAGATAIEYGLIAALIAMAAISSMQVLGINLAGTFWTLANTMRGAPGGG